MKKLSIKVNLLAKNVVISAVKNIYNTYARGSPHLK